MIGWILKKLNRCCLKKKLIHRVYAKHNKIKTEYGYKDVQFWVISCENCEKADRKGESVIKTYIGKTNKGMLG